PGSRAGVAVHVRRLSGREARHRPRPTCGTRSRPRVDTERRGADRPPHLHGDARAAPRGLGARPRAPVLGAGRVKIRVGHLYPDHLNIYADRGNIAVLANRASRRGIDLEVSPSRPGNSPGPGAYDLLYVGGGQDREQALIAPDLAAKGPALREEVERGVVVLAVCGGYQLLGRFYRDRYGAELPGAEVFPLHTVAGDRRMIGDVLIEWELGAGSLQTVAGFENHAGRTILDEGARPLGRVIAGF